MITKFKLFESLNEGEPEEGDYVIIDYGKSNDINFKSTNQLILNSIGRISNIVSARVERKNVKEYYVKYENSDISMVVCNFNQIKYWSKNREDIQIIIDANKYNL